MLVKEYVAAFKTGNLSRFKAALPAVEKAFPGNPYSLYFRAFYTEASGGDLTAAMKGYSDAIRLKPDFTEAYQHRAGLFYKKGLDDRAVADMDKAIETAGTDVYAVMYGDRGEFKYAARDHSGAFADYKKAAEMEPANPKWYRGVVNTAMALKNPAAAEAVIIAALNGTQGSNGGIRLAYADLLLRQQKFADADAQYTRALSAAGYQPVGKDYNSAGIAAMKLRDYPRANKLLEQAMALAPSDVDIILNRASVAMEQKAWAVGIARTNRGETLAAEYEAKAKKLEAAGN